MSHTKLLRYIPIKEDFMKELDVVRLIQEFKGLPVGTEGTIVHKYDDSMYEVEFFSKDGNTLDVITTPKSMIELSKSYK